MVAATRALALVLLFALCVGPHLASKAIAGRSRWPRRFLAGAAWICGARVRVTGNPAGPHSLLLANHVSWLDILVLGGATSCAFVSKDNLGHGIVHWLADQNATLYIRREDRRGARDQVRRVATRLEGPQPLALFPEGTTGPGDRLLPFRSPLLAALNEAGRTISARPVAIDYGPDADDIGWFGESGRDNVLRVLGRTRRVDVTVKLLDPLDNGERKAVAQEARARIASALGLDN